MTSDFQQELERLKERVEGNMPPGYLEIMHGATQQLIDSGMQQRVLGVGARFPDFELPDQHDKARSSSELLSARPLVLTFYRGFWCPYCNADLANLNRYVARIEERGATLIGVSPEKPLFSRRIIKTQKLAFDILYDAGNRLAEQLGLKFAMPADLKQLYRDSFNINLRLYHGDNDWTLPMPARFVVDTSGVIRYAESCPDYTCRPDPDELLDVLATL